jgi:hypothetical protein
MHRAQFLDGLILSIHNADFHRTARLDSMREIDRKLPDVSDLARLDGEMSSYAELQP